MRRKFSFALALAASLGFQAAFTQTAQAKDDLFCSRPVAQACANYTIPGFSSYADCTNFYAEYCPVQEAGEGCYYDPRVGYTICL